MIYSAVTGLVFAGMVGASGRGYAGWLLWTMFALLVVARLKRRSFGG